MSVADKRTEILNVLRSVSSRPMQNENAVWRDIEVVMARQSFAHCPWNPKKEIDACVYALALVYTHATGIMPAFTNCESPTRFERFLLSIPMPPEFRITRNRIKAAIRRLDAKRNPAFADDLRMIENQHAAE
jgi:hypothetical protein